MRRRRKVGGSVKMRGRVPWCKVYDGTGKSLETPAWKVLGVPRASLTTREAAYPALEILMAQKLTRSLPTKPGERLTIADALDRYFMDYQARAREANPARAERRIKQLAPHVALVKRTFGTLPAAEKWGLTWGALKAEIDTWRAAGLRRGTIHKYVGIVRTALKFCKSEHMIPDRLDFPKMATSPVRTRRPLPGEAELITGEINEGAARDAIRVVQITGWRRAEAAELQWSRVQWDTAPKWIRLRTSDRKKAVTLARPLLKEQEPELLEILARWRAKRALGLDAVFYVTRGKWGHNGPPHALTAKYVGKVWDTARADAMPAIRRLPGWTPDLPPLSLHDFRRKVLDELLASNLDPEAIRVLMGWDSMNSLRRYAEGGMSDDRMVDAVARLAAYRTRRSVGTAAGTDAAPIAMNSARSRRRGDR